MSVDGTDLSKVTGEGLKAAAEAAVAAAAPRAGLFLSHALAAVLAVALPLVGAVAGYFGGRATLASSVVEVPAGSGSAVAAPAASGSAAAPEAKAVAYDAKTVAADAVLGTGAGSAAPAVEADAK